MSAPRPPWPVASHVGGTTEYPGRRSARRVTLVLAGSLVAVCVLLALGLSSLALGAGAACAAMAIVCGVLFSEPLRALGRAAMPVATFGPAPGGAAQPAGNFDQGDPGRYLDIDAVEVEAVYVLGDEVYTHLTGGVGSVLDILSGDERHIETSDVSLTWRCQGRRSAEKLAERLNDWEARGAHLRLMAARGRCALLIEDDDHWVALPELLLVA